MRPPTPGRTTRCQRTWYEQPSPGEHHSRDLTNRARELYFS